MGSRTVSDKKIDLLTVVLVGSGAEIVGGGGRDEYMSPKAQFRAKVCFADPILALHFIVITDVH